jgi:hypothetical protein
LSTLGLLSVLLSSQKKWEGKRGEEERRGREDDPRGSEPAETFAALQDASASVTRQWRIASIPSPVQERNEGGPTIR